MHGSSSSGSGKKIARIEIIPLIDVIFFLLATFVLFTLSLNKSEGVPVSLPQTVTGGARDTHNSITVSVTEKGTIAWMKESPVPLDVFIKRIADYYRQDPTAHIIINGDEKAPFSQAVYVFDESRKAGFSKVFIETRVRAKK
jgi:biopolymer transport protein ExbD